VLFLIWLLLTDSYGDIILLIDESVGRVMQTLRSGGGELNTLLLFTSDSLGLFHMGLGLFVAFGVAWFNTDRSTTRSAIPRWRIVWYFPWLVGRILQSGFHLSILILHPALPIDPKVIRYRTNLREGTGIVLLGNSITLTPGTITVEINSQELVVHTMDDKSADDVTSQRLEQQIARLFVGKGME
jgi:multicomponent Na+:H+ antiporter subunit E